MPPPVMHQERPQPPSALVTVLRPELYNRLVRRFGTVKITNQGVACVSTLVVEGKKRKRVCYRGGNPEHNWGEQYRVNCPYCKDTIQRLYIGHTWGKLDPDTGYVNKAMLHCYNDDCLRDFFLRDTLYKEVFSECPVEDSQDVVHGGVVRPVEFGAVANLGTILKLTGLPKDHKPVRYLEERGYNIKELEELYDVGYVQEVNDPLLRYHEKRIYIPITRDGVLIGYQCRFVGEPPRKGVPKYVFSQNCPRANILYNFDRARKYKFTVLLEGATKVWRFGPEATASFGKIVTQAQADLLAKHWEKIVILLDPNAKDLADKLYPYLKGLRPDTVLLNLQNGVEPDDMTTPDLRNFVFESAAKAGVVLS